MRLTLSRPNVLWLVAGVLVAVLALWLGCGLSGGATEIIGSDGEEASGSNDSIFAWPPTLGEPYPDLQLNDHLGRPVSLSQFKGKVILVEPVGISCPACQALAGAHDGAGGFRGVRPQPGLDSIEGYAPRYGGGVSLDDSRIVFVQLLLYDMTAARAPTQEDARNWAEHFGTSRYGNRVVLVGDERLIGPASYNMIPGFQLVDADFVLRSDSTGHNPRHDLYTQLLPLLGDLVRETDVTPKPTTGIRVGDRMTDFTLADARGESRSLSQLRGGSAAFIYVYSGCCGHCSDQLPKVAEKARGFEEQGAVVVGVEYLGSATSCKRKRTEHDLPGTILADSKGEVCAQLGVGDFTVFLLRDDGVIRYRGGLSSVPAHPSDLVGPDA